VQLAGDRGLQRAILLRWRDRAPVPWREAAVAGRAREKGSNAMTGRPALLTEAEVIRARAMRRLGVDYVDIARTLGRNYQTVRNAVVGRTWRRLPDPVRPRSWKRLTHDEQCLIARLLARGWSFSRIAVRLGCSRRTVGRSIAASGIARELGSARDVFSKRSGRGRPRLLVDQQVVRARNLRRMGHTYREIARQLGVSLTTAYRAAGGLS
jgi:DNA-binding CsgD family transcriptional regulator